MELRTGTFLAFIRDQVEKTGEPITDRRCKDSRVQSLTEDDKDIKLAM